VVRINSSRLRATHEISSARASTLAGVAPGVRVQGSDPAETLWGRGYPVETGLLAPRNDPSARVLPALYHPTPHRTAQPLSLFLDCHRHRRRHHHIPSFAIPFPSVLSFFARYVHPYISPSGLHQPVLYLLEGENKKNTKKKERDVAYQDASILLCVTRCPLTGKKNPSDLHCSPTCHFLQGIMRFAKHDNSASHRSREQNKQTKPKRHKHLRHPSGVCRSVSHLEVYCPTSKYNPIIMITVHASP
jgi:hypothetical protein